MTLQIKMELINERGKTIREASVPFEAMEGYISDFNKAVALVKTMMEPPR
jgi:hypothetical protein